jgi:hypothetical protein
MQTLKVGFVKRSRKSDFPKIIFFRMIKIFFESWFSFFFCINFLNYKKFNNNSHYSRSENPNKPKNQTRKGNIKTLITGPVFFIMQFIVELIVAIKSWKTGDILSLWSWLAKDERRGRWIGWIHIWSDEDFQWNYLVEFPH